MFYNISEINNYNMADIQSRVQLYIRLKAEGKLCQQLSSYM